MDAIGNFFYPHRKEQWNTPTEIFIITVNFWQIVDELSLSPLIY